MCSGVILCQYTLGGASKSEMDCSVIEEPEIGVPAIREKVKES